MSSSSEQVAAAYFDAIARHDLDGLAACWSRDGVDHLAGTGDLRGPTEVRAYFAELFRAFPDLAFEVRRTVADEDRVAVHWTAAGTFAGPGSYQGVEPTGAPVRLDGLDLLRVVDGQIVRNDAFPDGIGAARQIGLLPASGSKAERRLYGAFNVRTRALGRLAAEPERIAEGVWIVRAGFPLKMFNVYLLEDDGGVTLFDAGIRQMTNALAGAGSRLGGIRRIVLGHAHPDHRGAAAALPAPVYCHAAERPDAEGDGGLHYFDRRRFRPHARPFYKLMLPAWDGGPVRIAGTLEEGDDVCGFKVVHVPGHAPGQIALWRPSDRVALTSDCFYTLDIEIGRKVPPKVPHPATNADTEQARASIRKLAALDLSAAWPGHADPVVGDVRGQLERAAAA